MDINKIEIANAMYNEVAEFSGMIHALETYNITSLQIDRRKYIFQGTIRPEGNDRVFRNVLIRILKEHKEYLLKEIEGL